MELGGGRRNGCGEGAEVRGVGRSSGGCLVQNKQKRDGIKGNREYCWQVCMAA